MKKSTSVPAPGATPTSWVADQSCDTVTPPPGVQSDYRVDINRVSGNQVFRRYKNGQLDTDAARDMVLEVVYKAKSKIAFLTDLEKIVLSVYFPGVFDFLDERVAAKISAHQLNLTPQEIAIVSTKVAIALQDHMLAAITQTGVSQ